MSSRTSIGLERQPGQAGRGSYALGPCGLAKALEAPLLFKGTDLAATDVISALEMQPD